MSVRAWSGVVGTEPAYRGGRPHVGFLANLGLGRARLEAAVREAFGAVAAAAGPEDWPHYRVRQLVTERYASPSWTHRL